MKSRSQFTTRYVGTSAVIGILAVVSIESVSCGVDKKKEEPEATTAASDSDIVLAKFPSDQVSPVQDPAKIGTPAAFKVLLPNDNSEISYRYESETFTVLVFDSQGQWINSDEDLVIDLASSSVSVSTRSVPDHAEVSFVKLRKGEPSVQFNVLAHAAGEFSVRLSATAIGKEGSLNLTSVIRKPDTVTNILPAPLVDVCALATYRFFKGSIPAFFNIGTLTELPFTGYGCSVYSDQACTTRVTKLSVPADSDTADPVYVKGTQNAFIEVTEQSQGFSARALCGGY